MKIDSGSVDKILVIRLRSIGDIILANPTLNALREKFPRATIDFLVDDIFEDVLRGNPNIDNVISNLKNFDGMKIGRDFALIRSIRERGYDMVVDLQGGPRGALLTLLSGARIRVGHPFRLRNRLAYNVYGAHPEITDHSWKVQFLTITGLGIDVPGNPVFFLDVSDKKKEPVKKRLEKAGFSFDRPLFLLHPGARIKEKKLPPEKMGIIARFLVDEKNCAVILAGNESDSKDIERIRKASGYALPYFTDLDLGELIALVDLADCLICNDSGPMHIAGALDIPTVAMFGPSDPQLWAPIGGRKITLTPTPMECMPCDQKNCPYLNDFCMTRLSVNEVKRAINRLSTNFHN